MLRFEFVLTISFFVYFQGYDDLRGTAKLYQKYYPDVLLKEYDSEHFLVILGNLK